MTALFTRAPLAAVAVTVGGARRVQGGFVGSINDAAMFGGGRRCRGRPGVGPGGWVDRPAGTTEPKGGELDRQHRHLRGRRDRRRQGRRVQPLLQHHQRHHGNGSSCRPRCCSTGRTHRAVGLSSPPPLPSAYREYGRMSTFGPTITRLDENLASEVPVGQVVAQFQRGATYPPSGPSATTRGAFWRCWPRRSCRRTRCRTGRARYSTARRPGRRRRTVATATLATVASADTAANVASTGKPALANANCRATTIGRWTM